MGTSSKDKHHGAKSVHCAVASSVCHFHSGAFSRARVMERLSIPAEFFTKQASARKDKKGIRKANKETTASSPVAANSPRSPSGGDP